MYTIEADFHKPGIYGGSVRVWATAWDAFRRAPNRVGRGRREAAYFVVRFGWGGFFFFFFSFLFYFFECTRLTATKRPPYLIYLSTSSLGVEIYPDLVSRIEIALVLVRGWRLVLFACRQN